MTITTALIVNVFLALATLGALASVVRLALRTPGARQAETLHPSQPIPLRLVRQQDEERDLARAA